MSRPPRGFGSLFSRPFFVPSSLAEKFLLDWRLFLDGPLYCRFLGERRSRVTALALLIMHAVGVRVG